MEMSKLSPWSIEEVKVQRPGVDIVVDLCTRTDLDKDVCTELLQNIEELNYTRRVSNIPVEIEFEVYKWPEQGEVHNFVSSKVLAPELGGLQESNTCKENRKLVVSNN